MNGSPHEPRHAHRPPVFASGVEGPIPPDPLVNSKLQIHDDEREAEKQRLEAMSLNVLLSKKNTQLKDMRRAYFMELTMLREQAGAEAPHNTSFEPTIPFFFWLICS